MTTMTDIRARVCERFGLTIEEMKSAKRDWRISHPRQVALYLSSTLAGRSRSRVASFFGMRNHTTVLHACRQIEKRRSEDLRLAADILALERELSA